MYDDSFDLIDFGVEDFFQMIEEELDRLFEENFEAIIADMASEAGY